MTEDQIHKDTAWKEFQEQQGLKLEHGGFNIIAIHKAFNAGWYAREHYYPEAEEKGDNHD
jgi:hypothetical protein